MKTKIYFLIGILLPAFLLFSCKIGCRKDPTYMTFYVNGEKFTAKGRKNCKGIYPMGSLVVDEYNVEGYLSNDKHSLSLDARTYRENENKEYGLTVYIIDNNQIHENGTYILHNVGQDISYMVFYYTQKYTTFDHSGTVTITDMEELEDGHYRIDGRFEALLVNEAGTDTLRITGGEFRTVTE